MNIKGIYILTQNSKNTKLINRQGCKFCEDKLNKTVQIHQLVATKTVYIQTGWCKMLWIPSLIHVLSLFDMKQLRKHQFGISLSSFEQKQALTCNWWLLHGVCHILAWHKSDYSFYFLPVIRRIDTKHILRSNCLKHHRSWPSSLHLVVHVCHGTLV